MKIWTVEWWFYSYRFGIVVKSASCLSLRWMFLHMITWYFHTKTCCVCLGYQGVYSCTLSSQSWLMARFPGLRSCKSWYGKANNDCKIILSQQQISKRKVRVITIVASKKEIKLFIWSLTMCRVQTQDSSAAEQWTVNCFIYTHCLVPALK